MASLGELERAVMDLLWAGHEAATANTLRDLLAQSTAAHGGAAGHEGKDLAVTTVLTVLSRLEKRALWNANAVPGRTATRLYPAAKTTPPNSCTKYWDPLRTARPCWPGSSVP